MCCAGDHLMHWGHRQDCTIISQIGALAKCSPSNIKLNIADFSLPVDLCVAAGGWSAAGAVSLRPETYFSLQTMPQKMPTSLENTFLFLLAHDILYLAAGDLGRRRRSKVGR